MTLKFYLYQLKLVLRFSCVLTLFCHSSIILIGQKTTSDPAQSLKEIALHHHKFTDEEIINTYNQVAGAYLYSDPDSAQLIYQEFFDKATKWQRPALIAEALASQAMIYEMKGQWTRSIPLYNEALMQKGVTPRRMILYHAGLGNLYGLEGNQDQAEMHLIEAERLVIVHSDSALYSEIYLKKATLHERYGRYHSALEELHKSLKYADNGPSPLVKLNILEIMIKCYERIEEYNKAHEICLQAIEEAEALGYRSTKAKFQAFRAQLLMKTSQTSEAVPLLLALIDQYSAIPKEKEIYLAHLSLTNAFVELGQIDKASLHLKHAKDFYKDSFSDVLKKKIHYAEAIVHRARNNMSQSSNQFLKLVDINSRLGDQKSLISNYLDLGENAMTQQSWKDAYHYQAQALTLDRELDVSKQKELISDLEKKYELSLKSEQIQNLETNNALQNRVIASRNRFLLLLGLGLTLVLGGLLYVVYLLRQRSENLKEIEEKNAFLEKAIAQNKMLVKEMHHRVKNNLQVVSSLLNLQGYFEKDEGVISAIQTGKMRIQSMSLLHQNLYKNTDLNQVEIKKYLEDLIHTIVTDYPVKREVELDINIGDIRLDIDTVVPLGLLTNEIVTNSLKHAFSNHKNPELKIILQEENNVIRLLIKDNGKGLPFTTIPKSSDSVGVQLIRTFAQRLGAKIELDSFKGAEVKLTFTRSKPATELFSLSGIAS